MCFEPRVCYEYFDVCFDQNQIFPILLGHIARIQSNFVPQKNLGFILLVHSWFQTIDSEIFDLYLILLKDLG